MDKEFKKIKNDYNNLLGLLNNVKIFKTNDKLFYGDYNKNIEYDYFDNDKKYKYILYSLNEAIANYDNYALKNILNYFENEIKLKKKKELEDKLISLYQNEIERIKNSDGSNLCDISSYFECLEEALKSYDEKELGSNYSFYSKEMNSSIHRGLNMDFSISKKELPHLLGLRNPLYDNDDLLLDMYNKYLNSNDLDHTEDNYIFYLKNFYKNDLENLIHSNKLSYKDLEMIKNYILKSFDKCLTFIKIYEYKRIPEIIVDYQIIDNYGKTFSSDHTKDLITKASSINNNPDLIPKKKLTEIKIGELKHDDLKKLRIIWKLFNVLPSDIYIKYDYSKNEYDFDTIVVNDVIYSYRKENYWSELNPNIFLVSYDVDEYKKEHKILKKNLDKVIKILGAKIKKDLKINMENTIDNVHNKSIFDIKRKRLVNLDLIKETIETITDADIKDYQDDFDIIYDKTEEDFSLSKQDYDNLKEYMENIFGDSLKNKVVSSFNITDKLNEQPNIRMIHRIMDKLLRKNKDFNYPKKNISIIGFGTIRNNHGKFTEKFAKTLMGKTFLQLEYDLRVNGYSYKLDGIYDNENKIYYSYNLLMDNPSMYGIYNRIKTLVKSSYKENNIDKIK